MDSSGCRAAWYPQLPPCCGGDGSDGSSSSCGALEPLAARLAQLTASTRLSCRSETRATAWRASLEPSPNLCCLLGEGWGGALVCGNGSFEGLRCSGLQGTTPKRFLVKQRSQQAQQPMRSP